VLHGRGRGQIKLITPQFSTRIWGILRKN